MAADRMRTQILDAYNARIWSLYNSTTGSIEKLFRAHWRGPIRPMAMMPGYIVSDNGQRRAPGRDHDDGSEERLLSVRVTLFVADNWQRDAAIEDWTDRVDQLDGFLRGRPGYGIVNIRYVSDDPMDVVFTSGKSAAVWVLDHEVEYFAPIDENDDWV